MCGTFEDYKLKTSVIKSFKTSLVIRVSIYLVLSVIIRVRSFIRRLVFFDNYKFDNQFYYKF